MRSANDIIQAALKEKRGALFEHEAKELVRSLGVIVPRFEIADPRDEQALHASAEKLGFPIAIKAESPAVLHKTEAGAVVLDIRNRAELASAVKQITASVSQRVPGAVIRHFLLEKMMPPGLELLIGGLRDEQFGPSVAFGLGGIWTEAMKDAAFGILPMTRNEVIDMIDETRASLFFREFRGAAPLDREGVLSIITALSGLLLKHEEIRQIDLNPVRVYERGAAALDVRIVLAQ